MKVSSTTEPLPAKSFQNGAAGNDSVGSLQLGCWPGLPILPPPGEAVLIRVGVSPVRQVARREARNVLRAVLAAWSGLPQAEILLTETSRGPAWQASLAGTPLDISLSYGAGEAWIGLAHGGRIGVDVMRIGPFAEAQAVARDYLGPAAAAAIAQSPDSGRAFAAAWAKREAQLKCAKRGLTEWAGAEASAAMLETRIDGPDWVGAVAVEPDR